MAPKRGHVSRRKDQRQGPSNRQGPSQRHGPPSQRRGGGSGQNRPGPNNAYRRQRPGGRHGPVGPTTCPMCGAVVPDLKTHIRQRHDDPESHPRH